MKLIVRLVFVMSAVVMSACQDIDAVVHPARDAGPALAMAQPLSANLSSYNLIVSRDLEVSERNLYYPSGDIVWRGDQAGDRHQQVESILRTALNSAKSMTSGATPVSAVVELRRFHALTEKARYTYGGIHSIEFYMTVKNLRTGEIIVPRYLVKADLRAYGGDAALKAEANGLTQKVRLTRHLANVIAQELRRPGSTPKITERVAGLEE